MKILLYGINFFPELTGIGKYTGEMAQWLARQGHEVRVITAPPYYPEWKIGENYSAWRYQKEIFSGKLTAYRCPLWVPENPTAIKRILHLASFAFTSLPIALSQIIWKPDVVFAVEPPLFISPITVFLSKVLGVNSWLHVQDFEVDAAFSLGMLKNSKLQNFVISVESGLMKHFNVVSSISGKMLEKLKLKGLVHEKIRFFPNWVDTDKICPLDRQSVYRRELNIDDGVKVVLYSGNMGEKQGLDILVEAAKKIQSRADLLFLFCGNGAAKQRLQKAAADLNNIQWLDLQPLDKLNELLNLADIHLLPQRADAADLVMPSKLTGMLASGKPVIVTAHEGTEVASVVGGKGLVVPPGEPEALVGAIEKLLNDCELRMSLGIEARKYAEQYLNIDSIMKSFELDLYNLLSETL